MSDRDRDKKLYAFGLKRWDSRWLAHLCGFGQGGDSCCRRREFHLGLAPLIDSHVAAAKNKPLTADLAVPTFTNNVRVGHPKCGRARLSHIRGVGAEDRGSVRLRCMAPPDEAASSSGESVIADVVLENPKPEKVFLSLD